MQIQDLVEQYYGSVRALDVVLYCLTAVMVGATILRVMYRVSRRTE